MIILFIHGIYYLISLSLSLHKHKGKCRFVDSYKCNLEEISTTKPIPSFVNPKIAHYKKGISDDLIDYYWESVKKQMGELS